MSGHQILIIVTAITVLTSVITTQVSSTKEQKERVAHLTNDNDASLTFHLVSCDPLNTTDVQEACGTDYGTGLICSTNSLTCVCRTDEVLLGGHSNDRLINMEWVDVVSSCMASAESACNSAGDGPGNIECIPGYDCAQLDCEQNGNGVCLVTLEAENPVPHNTTRYCNDSSGDNVKMSKLGISIMLIFTMGII